MGEFGNIHHLLIVAGIGGSLMDSRWECKNYNDLYLDHREDWQKLISFGQEKCSRNRDLLSDWLTKIGYSPRQTNQAKHSGKKSSMWTVFQGSTGDPDFIFR
ncbi:hypothetical protein KY285_030446 [Solanum tuberosum]|nr:hypothetical protein KY285_030446 [Solanum tuberosum]